MNFYVINEIEGIDGEESVITSVAKARNEAELMISWNNVYCHHAKVDTDTYSINENHTVNLDRVTSVYECEFNILEKYIPLHQISLK